MWLSSNGIIGLISSYESGIVNQTLGKQNLPFLLWLASLQGKTKTEAFHSASVTGGENTDPHNADEYDNIP